MKSKGNKNIIIKGNNNVVKLIIQAPALRKPLVLKQKLALKTPLNGAICVARQIVKQ